MTMAASTADKYGDVELAKRLRDEVQDYRRAPMGVEYVYGTLEDAITLGLAPKEAISAVAHELSLTRDEFLGRYRRAERVAEIAHNRLLRHQEAAERLQQRRAERERRF